MTGAPDPKISEYRVRIDVDFDGLRWDGEVGFDLPVGSGRCALDCEGLRVTAVKVGAAAVPFVHDGAEHRLTFDLPPGGHGPVTIDFAGTIETKNLFGFYRSQQGDRYLLTTHCEPTGARRVFPCVDRPDRKARFVLTVRAPADLEVIANAPVRTCCASGDRREWAFEPTPEMSSYLFYLGVGRFDFRDDRST